jgi:hypothetical protein
MSDLVSGISGAADGLPTEHDPDQPRRRAGTANIAAGAA